MKISRWKLIKALGVRILGSTLYFTLMWGVLGVVSLLIYRTVEIGMTGGNVLKFIKDMWIVFFVLKVAIQIFIVIWILLDWKFV